MNMFNQISLLTINPVNTDQYYLIMHMCFKMVITFINGRSALFFSARWLNLWCALNRVSTILYDDVYTVTDNTIISLQNTGMSYCSRSLVCVTRTTTSTSPTLNGEPLLSICYWTLNRNHWLAYGWYNTGVVMLLGTLRVWWRWQSLRVQDTASW